MPLTKPLAGDVHVNRPLTNFAQLYLQNEAGFVALRGMPNMPVAKQSDLYWIFDRDDFWRDDAEERADGTESSGGSFTQSTDLYYARVYAHHKDVTDRQRANADDGIDLERTATRYVTEKLMILRERLFATAFMGTGIWSTDFSPTTKWDVSTSNPIAEFQAAKAIAQVSTGKRLNRAIFGRQAYDTLLNNDDILSRITGGATTAMPAMVQRQFLAQILELDSIEIMDAIRVTSTKGAATTTRALIGPTDDVLLYYAPMTVGLNDVTAGIQFSWTGLLGSTPSGIRVKRFRMEELEADRIEAEMALAYKKIAAELGYYFNNVTT